MALSGVKAVYLILDTKNGQQYVGSAYGDGGLLERWKCYADTFHGNNKLMKELICDHKCRKLVEKKTWHERIRYECELNSSFVLMEDDWTFPASSKPLIRIFGLTFFISYSII